MPEVSVKQEALEIHTYAALPADKNPMFFEKRVYQGSSGKVYPLPFVDRVSHEGGPRTYEALQLENRYLRLTVLPELGGRVYAALDKTNGYDFIYRNRVIKPQLVGLCGPWISGGIEFNWPQHHRPTTFAPVDHAIRENADGSRTVWVGEREPMARLKGMAGITLHPARAYVEVKVRLFNPTPLPQTFLWWANPAVHVHEHYQSFFPPDVDFVADHAKRDVSAFPVAHGRYYGVDYSRGVDLSYFKNIPVPTSYMVLRSAYDFFGGYDHARGAGIVHVASHHVAPGKKQWTWGAGAFGDAWYRNLTDADGPYIELMAGAYSDNQPDFAWLAPYETKAFSQFWYPFKAIGPPKMANLEAALNVDRDGSGAVLGLYTTAVFRGLRVIVESHERKLLDRRVDASPAEPYVTRVSLPPGIGPESVSVLVYRSEGAKLIAYRPQPGRQIHPPRPARAAPLTSQIRTSEQLYLTGLHLEQYRHATYDPAPYYREALKRDPTDARCNNALGLLLQRQGDFAAAATRFRRSIETLVERNPNPRDGEPYYNLGLALEQQGRLAEACDAFYKATWNHAQQAAAHYALARIACGRGDRQEALGHLDCSLEAAASNLEARNLKAAILRHVGRVHEAETLASTTAELDPLDVWSRNELYLGALSAARRREALRCRDALTALMRDQPEAYLDLALAYAAAGLFGDALELLRRIALRGEGSGYVYPMLYYYLGWLSGRAGRARDERRYYRLAARQPSDYCFPSRLESIAVLRRAQRVNPSDARAPYYLGNLLYDKRRYDDAIEQWERARRLDRGFSIVHRNLALAYHNRRHDLSRARSSLRRALAVNPFDARLLYELDQLERRAGASPTSRLRRLERHPTLVAQRDDLVLERCALLNLAGRHEEAIDTLAKRHFSPWEGGEGKVTEQWAVSHRSRARTRLAAGRIADAASDAEASLHPPQNLGEASPPGTAEAEAQYLIGLTHEAAGEIGRARAAFTRAAGGARAPGPARYWQARALAKLGRDTSARATFRGLISEGRAKRRSKASLDYFAISLPDMLLFDDDIERRKEVEGRILVALGWLGLGRRASAARELRAVLDLDPSHSSARSLLSEL